MIIIVRVIKSMRIEWEGNATHTHEGYERWTQYFTAEISIEVTTWTISEYMDGRY